MLILLFSLLLGGSHEPVWVLIFCTVVISVLVIFLGIAGWAAIFGATRERQEGGFKVFRELVAVMFKRSTNRAKARLRARRRQP